MTTKSTKGRAAKPAKAEPGEFLDIDVLRGVAVLLYGCRWQTQLAQALNVAVRTVQRWDAEASRPPASLQAELRDLLKERRAAIAEFLATGF